MLDAINNKRDSDRELGRLQKVADDLNISTEEAAALEEEPTTDATKKERIRQSYIELASDKKAEPDLELNKVQQQDIEDINKIDPSLLTTDQLKEYIRIVDRINENGDFGGSGRLAALGKAQEGWQELNKLDTKTLNLHYLEELMDSQPMAIEAIFGLPDHAALFQLYAGIKGVSDASALSVREGENIAQMMLDLNKKLKGEGFSDESSVRQGVYQELIRQPENMSEDEALEINKKLISDSVSLNKSTGHGKQAKIEERLFNPFKNAKTIEEVKQIMQSIDPIGKKVVDAMIDYHSNHIIKETGETLVEHIESDNERFENKPTERVNNYGSPRRWKRVGRGKPVDFDDITEFNPASKPPTPKQLKSGKSLTMQPREGAVLDFNIHKNAVDNVQKLLLRSFAKQYQYQVRAFIKNEAGLKKLFGSEGNNDRSIQRTDNLIDAIFNENTGTYFNFERDQLNNGRPNTSKFVKALSSVLNGLKKTGYTLTLSGYTQAAKQATVLTNVARQLGSDAALTAKAVSELSQNKDIAKDFFRGETVDTRGEQASLLNVGKYFNAAERLESENKLWKFLSNNLPNWSERRFRKKWGGVGVLTATDVSVTKSSFLAFYRQYLKQKGIEYQGLEKENNLRGDKVRKEARAFAKQRVDTLQVVSNPAEQARMMKEQGVLPEVARAFLVPYGGFASASKARLYNDWKAIATGNSAQKKAAWKDVQATFIEQMTFNVVSKTQKLAVASIIALLLKNVAGIKLEYEDWDEWWGKTKKIVGKDMLFSMLPLILTTPGENGLTDLINYSYFNFLKQGEPDLTEKEYDKNHAPITRYKGPEEWYEQFGAYGAPIAKIAESIELANESNDSELTSDQQKLAAIAALAQLAQLNGGLPADISNPIKSEFYKQKRLNKENGTGNNSGNELRTIPLPRPIPKPIPLPRPIPR